MSAALPTTVQEAREANGTAVEVRTTCEFWWVTEAAGIALNGEVISYPSTRRTHSCIQPLDVGDGEHHWGQHQCADAGCEESTSIDVFDPEQEPQDSES